AASNNSVDDIRDLKEKVKYPPSKGRYKVYIIDEVHMLSKGAFNALLKTLEEPPSHLIFILATTEPQKLPATILSRCQRYDFKRITVKEIVTTMKNICDELNIEVEERGLQLIARNSDGAMRDALSILDQCISFADEKVSYEYILELLGTVNSDIIFDMADSIIEKDLEKSLKTVDELIIIGKDIHQFIKDMINHFRNLMVSKASDKLNDIIDGTEETIERFKIQSQNIELSRIIAIIKLLSEAEVNSKWSSEPRIILETTIMKMLSPELDTSVDSLLARISNLESAVKRGKIVVEEKLEDTNTKSNIAKTVSKQVTKKETIKKEEDKKEEIIINKEINENIDINDVMKIWPDMMKKIKTEKISIQALLSEGIPHDIEGNTLYVLFKDGFGFHKDAVNKDDNKKYIENTLNNILSSNMNIKFMMEDEVGKKEDVVDSLTKEVIDVFGEDIVEFEE
ncbi:MAG: DNA polymerase III subunit gamma/tau, partial [Senegalia sp. (in: firmicutes)]